MANYEITISDVTAALERAGLAYRVRGRYIVTQCPLHEERNPSCQIFFDDWFANCLAGCGRFPIGKAFPELSGRNQRDYHQERRPAIEQPKRTYQTFDLLEEWARLPLIPRAHDFKGIPLEVLDELGWRWEEARDSYFIPYWNSTKTSVPFAQWRHLSGERRFTFLAGAQPTLYGKWNISPGEKLFICEGTSDCAVLERCGVPWVGVPSASSGTILGNFARASHDLGISLVYAGDNDTAGDALKEALDNSGAHYRTCQPPSWYKDWGDFFVAEGDLAVFEWCKDKLLE